MEEKVKEKVFIRVRRSYEDRSKLMKVDSFGRKIVAGHLFFYTKILSPKNKSKIYTLTHAATGYKVGDGARTKPLALDKFLKKLKSRESNRKKWKIYLDSRVSKTKLKKMINYV